MNRQYFVLEKLVQAKIAAILTMIEDGKDVKSYLEESAVKMTVTKETGDVSLSVNGKSLHFAYDENTLADASVNFAVVSNSERLLNCVASDKGVLLVSPDGDWAEAAARLAAATLGRFIHVVRIHAKSLFSTGEENDGLRMLLEGLTDSDDMLCLRLSEGAAAKVNVPKLYQALKAQEYQRKSFQRSLERRTAPLKRVIFVQEIGSENADVLSLGDAFRVVKLNAADEEENFAQQLLKLGFDDGEDLAKHFSAIEKIRKEDCTTNSGQVLSKVDAPWVQSEAYKAVRERFLYGEVPIQQMRASESERSKVAAPILTESPWLAPVAARALRRPVDPEIEPRLQEALSQLHLDPTPVFRRQAQTLLDILRTRGSGGVLLRGPPLSGKSALASACARAMDWELKRYPGAALADDEGAQGFEKFLAGLTTSSVSRGKKLPLALIVVEDVPWSAAPAVAQIVRPLISSRRSLLSSGHLLVNRRRLALLVIDTLDEKDNLHPALEATFHVVKAESASVTHEAHLRHCIEHDLPQVSDSTAKKVTEYLRRFSVWREEILKRGDHWQYRLVNVNNVLHILKAAKVDSATDVSEVDNVLLWSCLFCFSQDFTPKQKDLLEKMVREALDCSAVPIDESLFDFIYENGAWTAYESHLPRDSPVLARHARAVKIARLLLKNGISFDVIGPKDSGKSTLLKHLSEWSANSPDGEDKDLSLFVRCGSWSDPASLVDDLWKVGTASKATMELVPFKGGKLNVFLDDVDRADQSVAFSAGFLGRRHCWPGRAAAKGSIANTTFVASYSGEDVRVTNGSSFVLLLSQLDHGDHETVFKRAIGNHFASFEVEVQFHVERLISASVAVNEIASSDGNQLFSLSQSLKMAEGLKRAHPDRQDTPEELTNLWLHEVSRSHADRVANVENKDVFVEAVSSILRKTVSEESANCWMEAQLRDDEGRGDIYADFDGADEPISDTYSRVDVSAALAHMRKAADGSSDGAVVFSQEVARLYCKIRRALSLPEGHCVFLDPHRSLPSSEALIATVARSQASEWRVLRSTHSADGKWRQLFRELVRLTGYTHCYRGSSSLPFLRHGEQDLHFVRLRGRIHRRRQREMHGMSGKPHSRRHKLGFIHFERVAGKTCNATMAFIPRYLNRWSWIEIQA